MIWIFFCGFQNYFFLCNLKKVPGQQNICPIQIHIRKLYEEKHEALKNKSYKLFFATDQLYNYEKKGTQIYLPRTSRYV